MHPLNIHLARVHSDVNAQGRASSLLNFEAILIFRIGPLHPLQVLQIGCVFGILEVVALVPKVLFPFPFPPFGVPIGER